MAFDYNGRGRIMNRAGSIAAVTALALLGAAPACAASDDAWEAFRKDVADKCLEAATDLFAAPVATVDPFGSQSYGLALIRGKAKGADADIAAICVYDKKTQQVEIGGELPPQPAP
jgi:ABC-type amino acid transport substrate-binding protein